MTNCPRCRQPVDAAATAMCPNCGAPLSGQASPVSTYRPGAIPPRRDSRVPQRAEPRFQADGMKSAVRAAVILIPTIFILGGLFYYRTQNAAFNKQLDWDLSTPVPAATEIFGAVRDEAWAKLFLLCQFQEGPPETLAVAEQFAQGFRNGQMQNPEEHAALKAAVDSVTDLRFGPAQVKGHLADVPITGVFHINGQTAPLNGIAHLIKGNDSKWRLNMSAVSIGAPERTASEFGRVYGSLLNANASEALYNRMERGGGTPPGAP